MTAFVNWWNRTPLYLRIAGGLVLGALVGTALGAAGAAATAKQFELPAKMILRLLGMLAPPLVLVAVVQALMRTEIGGTTARRLTFLLLLNTLVAIFIGLLVANVLAPGRRGWIDPPSPSTSLAAKETDPQRRAILETMESVGYKAPAPKPDALTAFLESVPKAIGAPLVENNVIGVILLAIAFGTALRPCADRRIHTLADVVDIAFSALLRILHWVLNVVPVGVFGIVVAIVGEKGFAPFLSLGRFVGAVLAALALQAVWYLVRVKLGSWVRPLDLLRGCRDALVTAFSTASSTATMPVTYDRLVAKVGLRERSASLGALVGANFNNDGTALYEAMSALFVAQLMGSNLSIPQQIMVVLTSVVASVGAAGIPEAGLVTMTLVFTAVGLDVRFIALLLTVDWFLDRCRTTVNVMGDMNVSCLIDGRSRASATPGEGVSA
ncbi:MAG: dicarboxylate/amino acid:cation symporter [Armatimonadota bacterium]